MQLKDVLGQDELKSNIINLIQKNQLPHAIKTSKQTILVVNVRNVRKSKIYNILIYTFHFHLVEWQSENLFAMNITEISGISY
jgi:hypothetical protein